MPTQETMVPRTTEEWTKALRDLWQDELFPHASRGRRYRRQVPPDLAPDSQGVIRCPIVGSWRYEVTISATPDVGLVAECTCPYSAGEYACKHGAAVVSVLLERLEGGETFGPADPAKGVERALQLYASRAAGERQGTLWWRLRFGPRATDVLLAATVETPSGKPRTLALSQLQHECGRTFSASPEDARLVALLAHLGRGGFPPSLGAVALLDFLVGHPRVALEGATDPRPLVRAEAGLAVEKREGGFVLYPAIAGEPVALGPGRGAVTSHGFVLWRSEKKEAVVAVVAPALGDLLAQVAGFASTPIAFERMVALVGKIESAHPDLPLALPEEFRPRTVDASRELVLLVTPRSNDPAAPANVALRARPIASGPAVVPGAAPPRIVSAVGGERVAAVRDLAGEVERAHAVARELELPVNLAGSLGVDLGGEDLLDLLVRFQERAPADVALEWAKDALPRTVARFDGSSFKVSVRPGQDWFDLEGQLGEGENAASLAQVLAALREGRRYVELGKGRFAEIAKLLRGRLADLALVAQERRKGEVSIPRAAVAIASEALEKLPVEKPPLSWTKLLAGAKDALALAPEPPGALKAELRAYQKEGWRWLARLAALGVGGCLADDMGLGKTVQAIAALLARREGGPALVVAPTSVGFNWERELARFAPSLRVFAYRGAGREQLLEDATAGSVVVTSYGLLRRDEERLSEIEWNTVVLDEAQAIKNGASQTARVARSLRSAWTVALTGTPVENHLGELWSLFSVLAPGLLGSFEQFATRFARPIESGKDPERRKALSRLIRPFVLRRTKGEVLKELPARTEVRLDVELSKAERARYEDARLEALAELARPRDQGDPRFQVLAALTRLRQLACHPRLVDPRASTSSSKLDALLEQVETVVEEGHRVLVFSQFVRHLELVAAAFKKKKIKSLWLDGGTTPRDRARLVDEFQQGKAPVFLISLKAGGTGLNLTAADHVFLLDPWWNPAVEDQAADRAHRIGQTRPVTIVRLVARGTIEEKVLALHEEKRDLVAGLLEGTARAGKLSTEELVDLLRDSHAEGTGKKRVVEERAARPSKPAPARSPEKKAASNILRMPAATPRTPTWGDLQVKLDDAFFGQHTKKTSDSYRSVLRTTIAVLGPSGLASARALLEHMGRVDMHPLRRTVLRRLVALMEEERVASELEVAELLVALAAPRWS